MDRNERLVELFDEMVPPHGPSNCLAGEIVRAATKIGYRLYNDGDHIGVNYGNETCNTPARFLIANLPKDGGDIVVNMWGVRDEDAYSDAFDALVDYVISYVDSHSDLRDPWETPDDMLGEKYQDDSDYDYEDDYEDYVDEY